MGKKIVETEVICKKNTHVFYCDKCNEKIGERIEYEDCLVDDVGLYENDIFYFGKWYSIRKYLCKSCFDLMKNNFIQDLKKHGYELNEEADEE